MRRGVETVAAGRKDRPYGTFTSYVAYDRTALTLFTDKVASKTGLSRTNSAYSDPAP